MTFVTVSVRGWEVTGLEVRNGVLVRNWVTKLPIINKWPAELEKYRQALAYAKSKGLKVHLHFAPNWHNELSESDYLYVTQESFSFVANSLAGYVDVWQLWNEPDIFDFRSYQALSGAPSTEYLDKFKAAFLVAAKEIRKIKPNVRISINAGGYYAGSARAVTQSRWLQMFDSFKDLIPQGFLTDIKLNVYTAGNNQGIVEGINEFTKYSVPIWIGEFGYPTANNEEKKRILLDTIRALLQTKVVGINLYRMRDNSDAGPGDRFGIDQISSEIFQAMK